MAKIMVNNETITNDLGVTNLPNIFTSNPKTTLDSVAKFPDWDIIPFDEIINPRVKSVKVENNNTETNIIDKKIDITPSPVNEKTNSEVFSVLLTSLGNDKVSVVKLIKNITGLGLAESKNLSEQPSPVLIRNISKEKAEEIKRQLENLGANTIIQ